LSRDLERREAARVRNPGKAFAAAFYRLKKLDALVLSDYDKGLITDDLPIVF